MIKLVLKWLAWLLGLLLLVVLVLWVAFQVSPWPGALVLKHSGAFVDAPKSRQVMSLLEQGRVKVVRDISYATKGARHADDMRLDLYRPANAQDPLPLILWVHGGAFVAGWKDGLDAYLPLLSDRGYVTASIDYTLAPAEHYPFQVNQVGAALRYLTENAERLGIDPQRIILGGDSAGTHIVAQAAMAIRDTDYAKATGVNRTIQPSQLRGVLLMSGTYYFMTDKPINPDFVWIAQAIRWAYLGEKHPEGVPSLRYTTLPDHVSASFPPALLVAGDGDPLAKQSERMTAALLGKGVDAEYLFVKGKNAPAPHEFQFLMDTPEAQQVLDITLKKISTWTGQPQ